VSERESLPSALEIKFYIQKTIEYDANQSK